MLFRTTNKNLMERIATNAQKYLPWNWEKLNTLQKHIAIKETLDLLSESASTSSIVTEHNGETLVFRSMNMQMNYRKRQLIKLQL